MRNQLSDWLQTRTGHKTLGDNVLREMLPGGARWRYVFGPALAATFLIQMVTGLLLMSSYVPSASQAWGSVWYIQNQMQFGWFIRGLHHFGSSAMVILLVLHLVQAVVTRAYRAPREVNWWLGLILMQLVLGLALTGYLLPWDQKGYWATKVATNIMGSTPVIGPALLQVIVGGSEYGNQTLTRLFSLHVGVLPWLIVAVLAVHILLYYRHGASAPEHATGAEAAWPGQVFRNLVAVAMVLAVLVGVTLYNGGANLEAPADPAFSEYPARPEWYFLPLFQMLNYFESPYEVIGTHILPGVLFGFLFALPLLDHVLPRRMVYASACAVLGVTLGAVGLLMTEAIFADQSNVSFQLARTDADTQRERALQLANAEGVPPDGAVYVLRRDPWTNGRAVLNQRCLSCHYYDGEGQRTRQVIAVTSEARAEVDLASIPTIEGLSEPAARAMAAMMPEFTPVGPARPTGREGGFLGGFVLSGTTAQGDSLDVVVTPDGRTIQTTTMSVQAAADLKGFGTRDWVRGLLEDPSSPTYFGTTPALKGMKTWKSGSTLDADQLDLVADFVAELADVRATETFFSWFERRYVGDLENHPGHDLFVEDCGQCHVVGQPDYSFTEGGFMEAPNLYAYGSTGWLRRMINQPEADDLYGYLPEEDRMPAFEGRLSESDETTLIRFLQGDYLRPDAAPAAMTSAEATVAE